MAATAEERFRGGRAARGSHNHGRPVPARRTSFSAPTSVASSPFGLSNLQAGRGCRAATGCGRARSGEQERIWGHLLRRERWLGRRRKHREDKAIHQFGPALIFSNENRCSGGDGGGGSTAKSNPFTNSVLRSSSPARTDALVAMAEAGAPRQAHRSPFRSLAGSICASAHRVRAAAAAPRPRAPGHALRRLADPAHPPRRPLQGGAPTRTCSSSARWPPCSLATAHGAMVPFITASHGERRPVDLQLGCTWTQHNGSCGVRRRRPRHVVPPDGMVLIEGQEHVEQMMQAHEGMKKCDLYIVKNGPTSCDGYDDMSDEGQFNYRDDSECDFDGDCIDI